MLEPGKKLKELSVRLNDKNDNTVISAIRSLRNEKPYYGAIQLLAETYNRSENTIIKDLIRNFMNDIKELKVRSEVIAEIKRDYSPGTVGMLVASCWQSGLDYAGYAYELAQIFIKYDYTVAIECFTVIEESVMKIPEDIKSKMVLLLKEKAINASKEKAALAIELIRVLS